MISSSSSPFNGTISIIRFRNPNFPIFNSNSNRFHIRSTLNYPQFSSSIDDESNNKSANEKSRVLKHSVRVLEWDKVCDSVSSFAATSLGRHASIEQLWALDQSYDESLRLLGETNAAVEINKYSNVIMDFTSINSLLVKSAMDSARRSSPVSGQEAIAVATLLQLAEALQANVRSAIKENAELHKRFMPLDQLILEWVTNKSLVRSILRLVDEDGSIKDSALNQLMNALIANEVNGTPSLEASKVNGRWCIRSGSDQLSIQGLLLSSGSGMENIIEPVSVVPLNDELLEAQASVSDAEAEVLMDITKKIQVDLDGLELLLKSIVELDVINARARYGLSMKGSCPDLILIDEKSSPSCSEGVFPKDNSVNFSHTTTKQRKLSLPKAYHPLLLHQYQHDLQAARRDVANATAELRRRRWYGGNITNQDDIPIDLQMLQEKVNHLEKAHPIPVDFLIDLNTRVLLITGPNTGGKTVCLKSVGLAAIMAKAGLYVLCSEPAQIPWFDYVFADIGDEQSLSQSLSTFSGHLKQIREIQAKSTNQSMVLLDEIGAGTNPIEGAALGISVLESFAEAGALLTIATTHHGELKTLKYSNEGFENACMEFDEVNLKPTYKILWGVPGRSNAINIAERLGLPKSILHKARELYGEASAEIDEVIFELETFKQDVEKYVREAQHYWTVSKDLHQKMLHVQEKLTEHGSDIRNKKVQQISDLASRARSLLHRKMQEHRASAARTFSQSASSTAQVPTNTQQSAAGVNILSMETKHAVSVKESSPGSENKKRIPMVGDIVQVTSIGAKATVLQVDLPRGEMVVQAGMLKLKLKISDIS